MRPRLANDAVLVTATMFHCQEEWSAPGVLRHGFFTASDPAAERCPKCNQRAGYLIESAPVPYNFQPDGANYD